MSGTNIPVPCYEMRYAMAGSVTRRLYRCCAKVLPCKDVRPCCYQAQHGRQPSLLRRRRDRGSSLGVSCYEQARPSPVLTYEYAATRPARAREP
eukprot:1043971-Rhodomonas_salina.1